VLTFVANKVTAATFSSKHMFSGYVTVILDDLVAKHNTWIEQIPTIRCDVSNTKWMGRGRMQGRGWVVGLLLHGAWLDAAA